MTADFVRRWRLIAPDTEVLNLYGPTETTIVKCCYRVPELAETGIQPIGSALANSQALVLGPDDRNCGIGELGEIVLRTPFRSLGYLNSPEETHRRFFMNPLGSDPQDLLYRTGDRGRYRVDGTIEILGRLDRQVKIRGVRTEPGDVESVLLQYPDVERSVVLATEAPPLDRTLVAFLVCAKPALDEAGLRRFVLQHLPSWMIPRTFVVIDDMPLDNNGKIDRRALQAKCNALVSTATRPTMPTTASESLIVEHVKAIFGVEGLSPDTNFFSLGADLKSAERLVEQLWRQAGITLPLRVVFETPTIAELARWIDAHADTDSRGDLALLGRLSSPTRAVEIESIDL